MNNIENQLEKFDSFVNPDVFLTVRHDKTV
jgi:hypothetical protein